eukprot:gene247-4011_t
MLTGKNGPATRTVVDPAGGDIAGVPVALLRRRVSAVVRPQWLQALATNPVRYKIIVSNGRIVRKRALPFDIAVPLVTAWIPAAVETIRQDGAELDSSLALWDQAQQVVAGHANIDEESQW